MALPLQTPEPQDLSLVRGDEEPLALGKHVAVYPMSRAFVPQLYEVLMTPGARKMWRTRGQYLSPQMFEEYLTRTVALTGVMVRRDTEDVIGLAELLDVDPMDERAQLSIAVGEKFWNSSFGIEGAVLFLRHVFDAYAVTKMAVMVHDDNVRLRPGLDRFFEREGVLKRHVRVLGEWHDVTLYAIWRERFEELAATVFARLFDTGEENKQ